MCAAFQSKRDSVKGQAQSQSMKLFVYNKSGLIRSISRRNAVYERQEKKREESEVRV